jgi:hypothetical protein
VLFRSKLNILFSALALKLNGIPAAAMDASDALKKFLLLLIDVPLIIYDKIINFNNINNKYVIQFLNLSDFCLLISEIPFLKILIL